MESAACQYTAVGAVGRLPHPVLVFLCVPRHTPANYHTWVLVIVSHCAEGREEEIGLVHGRWPATIPCCKPDHSDVHPGLGKRSCSSLVTAEAVGIGTAQRCLGFEVDVHGPLPWYNPSDQPCPRCSPSNRSWNNYGDLNAS